MIAIEEHFATPSITEAGQHGRWTQAGRALGLPGGTQTAEMIERLADLDEQRLSAMDEAGIDVQVLSHTQPGLEDVEGKEAISLAAHANDFLAAAISRHPDRFQGFALLPTCHPRPAADELERAVRELGLRGALVNGRSRGHYLDAAEFLPIFERAETLGVPVYLHPGVPPADVISSCYSGFAPDVSYRFAIGSWGWHIDTGIHVLRLILAGLFDRFPDLQIIVGHMGEAIPFMLERTNRTLPRLKTGLQREVGEYVVENLYFTTSGFFSPAVLRCLLEVVGEDRVIFAVDYPFATNRAGRDLLEHAHLGMQMLEMITHRNAEQLLKI